MSPGLDEVRRQQTGNGTRLRCCGGAGGRAGLTSQRYGSRGGCHGAAPITAAGGGTSSTRLSIAVTGGPAIMPAVNALMEVQDRSGMTCRCRQPWCPDPELTLCRAHGVAAACGRTECPVRFSGRRITSSCSVVSRPASAARSLTMRPVARAWRARVVLAA